MGHVRGEVQWLAVCDAVQAAGTAGLDVLDLGGGTGGAAVQLAAQGHRVRVVDPSANALAALHRRALDAQVEVSAIQGDSSEIGALIGSDAVDLVLCHGLFDVVDDPAAAVEAVVGVLRPGGVFSVIVPGLWGTIVSRLIAGDVDRAMALLDVAPGAMDAADDRRRYTRAEIVRLCVEGGLRIEFVHGLSSAVWVPEDTRDHEEASQARLIAFDRAAGRAKVWSEVSPGLHCVARLD